MTRLYDDPNEWIKRSFRNGESFTFTWSTDFVGTDKDCIVLTKGRDYQEENDGESNRVRGLFYSP
jgi:hypothetical protein